MIAIPVAAQTDLNSVPYGNNKATGNFLIIDGAKQYYEVYGQGEPLVLIHGNGGNIAYMKPQIEYFARKYQVMDADVEERVLALIADNIATNHT